MKNLLGGFAGALALNLLHETFKQLDAKAPRIDLVGEEALSNTIKSLGKQPPAGNTLCLLHNSHIVNKDNKKRRVVYVT